MHKLVMCSIYDVKAEAYHTPMFFQTEGQAIRAFSDAVNASDSDFARHPEDYTLFSLAFMDMHSGDVDPHGAAVPLMKAINCLTSTQGMEVVQ